MQTTDTLKRQIRTAEDLHSLVKTMKALAAVNINQFEQAVRSLNDYYRTVQLGMQVVLKNSPEAVSMARTAPRGRLGAVVFGSDQGMCGQLNDQIAGYAPEQIQSLGIVLPEARLLAVGARVTGRLEDAGCRVEAVLPVPSSTSGITPMVQEIVLGIERWHAKREVDRIVLFYCRHLSGASYEPHTVDLLPIDRAWLDRLEREKWPTRILPTLSMPPGELFSALIRQYLFVSVYRAFAESLASENAARLASMQTAERNIEERLASLTSQFHQQRQTAITGELLDIAAGFEAMGGSGP